MSNDTIQIIDYASEHHAAITEILGRIGWAWQYVDAAAQNAEAFSQQPDIYGTYVALLEQTAVGFIYVQFYAWNQLAQIQGLAVDPRYHRRGIAGSLVGKAEAFAHEKQARGIYVDTPTTNLRGRPFYEAMGYQVGYIMPRYYEDQLDGVTYQKFFDR